VVVAEERPRVGPELAGVGADRAHIAAAGIVGVQGTGHVGRGAVGPQQPGRGQNGIAGGLDVAAAAVALPGGGQELHRPLGSGRAGPPDPTQPGFHQVNGGQVLPGHGQPGLGRPVGGQQPPGRGGGDDPPARQPAGGPIELAEFAAGVHVGPHHLPQ
jgi:hypothetical protein